MHPYCKRARHCIDNRLLAAFCYGGGVISPAAVGQRLLPNANEQTFLPESGIHDAALKPADRDVLLQPILGRFAGDRVRRNGGNCGGDISCVAPFG